MLFIGHKERCVEGKNMNIYLLTAHNISWCKFNSVNYEVPKQLIFQHPQPHYQHKCRPLFSRGAAEALVLLHNVELYGSHAVAHLSDAWRILTDYKKRRLLFFYLDVIQLQSSSESRRNFVVSDVGLELMAAGAFHIQYKHPIQLALDEFRNTNRSSVKYMVMFKQLIKSNIIHFIFETTYLIYMGL